MELRKLIGLISLVLTSVILIGMLPYDAGGKGDCDFESADMEKFIFLDSNSMKNSLRLYLDECSEEKQIVLDHTSFMNSDLYEKFKYFMDPDSNYYIISKIGNNLQIEEITLSESQTITSLLQILDQDASYIVTEGNFSDTFVKTSVTECGYDGSYVVRTRIQYIEENNLRYNYYAVVHEIITMPGTNRYVEQVICDAEPTNLLNATYRIIDSYRPTGSDISTTVTLSLGMGMSGLEPSSQASISWSRDIPSIIVEDYSGINNVSLIFDFTDRFTAQQTRTQTMGYFVVVDCESSPFKTGSYMGSLDVEVKFVEERNWLIFPYYVYTSHSSSYDYTCTANPITITYNGNGSDYNEMFFDDPEHYLEDSYTNTYGQGDYITLYATEFVKSGYTAVGYSLDEDSDRVDYQFRTQIRATNSMTLYVVWREN